MSKTILFVGGGTGGHIAPLFAVMEAVQKLQPHISCAYVGTASDYASPIITGSKLVFERHTIDAGKLHRFLTIDQLRQALRIGKGLVQAERLLATLQPGIIFSKGGMVGVPVALAAGRRRIPLFSHETDAAPGLANRIVNKHAQTIFTGFPISAYPQLPATKLQYTGQPVRADFYKVQGHWGSFDVGGRSLSQDGLPILTILCGSQGAHQVNMLVQSVWAHLLNKVRIVQITGATDYAQLIKQREDLPETLRERLFITDFQADHIPELLHASQLVIARAGGTLFELAACRTPTVLVPLTGSAQDHQWKNARILEAAGAAVVVRGESVTSAEFLEKVEMIMNDRTIRAGLSMAIGEFDHPEAAQTIANTLIDQLQHV